MPQVNVLRDLLDIGAASVVCRENELQETLLKLKEHPKIVVTDSQAFKKVAEIVPDDVLLTSFSIIFARLKGDLSAFINGAKKLDSLNDGDKILILESCSHHSVEDDIGKVKIPDYILLKNGKLTDEEYSKMKKHPTIGKDILSNSELFEDILPIVMYHHERFDGKGYPYGLSDNNIPLLARIVSVADAFDAMTSRRSYRDELNLSYVKNELKSNSGTQFDPIITKTLLDILENDYEEICHFYYHFITRARSYDGMWENRQQYSIYGWLNFYGKGNRRIGRSL